jgi:hypothetical protein
MPYGPYSDIVEALKSEAGAEDHRGAGGLCRDAAAEIERLRGTLNVVRVYLDQNPLSDALVIPRGATIKAGDDLSQYPTLGRLVDAALGDVEQTMEESK